MNKIFYITIIMAMVTFVACSNHKGDAEQLYNQTASLSISDSLTFNPLLWTVITTVMDKNKNTMSTLYGNDIAVSHARIDGRSTYPQGATLSLVTWKKQEDKHWFGAKIPQQIQSIELIKYNSLENTTPKPLYEIYQGSPLRLSKGNDPSNIAERIAYITNQKASVIP